MNDLYSNQDTKENLDVNYLILKIYNELNESDYVRIPHNLENRVNRKILS